MQSTPSSSDKYWLIVFISFKDEISITYEIHTTTLIVTIFIVNYCFVRWRGKSIG
ncbi:hypothetical protein E2C01_053962 [Portunus trituberculatus]|uniref:Uncharacterized protein n=1 Tax=Portunus trituberculatus TaxID=210409 RepID=A0A5B7GI20_PORTR|nr:hypothetical protein [Portunus trituberculatus]